ncbi:MAG: hypothetical protein ABH827_02495 [bacterium]
MSKINSFFVGMCCFVMSFAFVSNCSAQDSRASSAQAKADVTALLSTLSVSELITVGHEVLRLSKEQGIADTVAEKLFRKTLEVIYEDVYVDHVVTPVVQNDVYIYDAPAPISVDFSVGSGSSSLQHIGPRTVAEKVAEVIVAVLGVTIVIVFVGAFIVAIANGDIHSERVIRREHHRTVYGPPVYETRVHHASVPPRFDIRF